MRGITHALAASTTGLYASTLLDLDLPHTLALTATMTGAAMLPDWDSVKSAVAHTSRTSTNLAQSVDGLSHRLYQATATSADVRRRDGHRGLTHTAVAALTCGATAAVLGLITGAVGIGLLILALGALGRRAIFGRARRRGAARVLVPVLSMGAVCVLTGAVMPPGFASAALLGGGVASGMLVHDLTDAPTESGVPLLWPLTIRGQRWWRLRLPRRWALRTGGLVDTLLLLGCAVASALQLGSLLGMLA